MKVQLAMKSPDAVDIMVQECLDNVDRDKDHEDFISLQEMIKRFVEYGEYVTLEFDTETGTVKVLEV